MILLLENTISPSGQERAIELVVSVGDDFYRINYTIPPDADAQIWIDDHVAQIEADAVEHGAPCDGAPYTARVDFEGLANDAATEIAWLDSTVPTISDPVVKRLARQNLGMLRAWRYALRRLS